MIAMALIVALHASPSDGAPQAGSTDPGPSAPAASPHAPRPRLSVQERLQQRTGAATGTTSGERLTQSLALGVGAVGTYGEELSRVVEQFPAYAARPTPWTATVRVVGSETMGPMVSNLAIGFQALYPDLKITVGQGGSSAGIDALAGGLCDVASVARPLTDAERARIASATGRAPIEVPIAMDAVCVYVNHANPIAGLTRDQLNGVFAITHSQTPQPILRWNQLDPASPLGGEFLPLYLLNAQSGTMQLFRDWCMPGEEFTTVLRFVEPGPSSVVNACCAYRDAIGIAGYGSGQPRARRVPVSAGAGRPFVEPTPATILDGSYPLSRPLNLVMLTGTDGNINPLVRDFLRYIWSETGQDTVATVGEVPPNPERIPAVLGEPVDGIWR